MSPSMMFHLLSCCCDADGRSHKHLLPLNVTEVVKDKPRTPGNQVLQVLFALPLAALPAWEMCCSMHRFHFSVMLSMLSMY